jgi:hypothetical protein
MNLESLTYISVPYPAIKIKSPKIMGQNSRVSSSKMFLCSDQMKVYGEHVDGEEATADICILSSLLFCKFTNKNISSI